MSVDLPEERRRFIFAALVAAQDEGQGVATSRESVAERYELSAEQVLAIEREGLQNQWPPL
jgi:hypothetical protein